MPIDAFVFDAYGTLFDVHSVMQRCESWWPGKGAALSQAWRAKQLEYTWLRSLMGRHANFREVTADALDYAMEALRLDDAGLRGRLLALYERLGAYPEARPTLDALRRNGLRLAVLSNGEPGMLATAATTAGLADLLEHVLSIEDVGIYKPHPRVYTLAVDRLGLATHEILFVSSNGWDAAGAKAFGLQVVWCNRAGLPAERLGLAPDAEIRALDELPALLGG